MKKNHTQSDICEYGEIPDEEEILPMVFEQSKHHMFTPVEYSIFNCLFPSFVSP